MNTLQTKQNQVQSMDLDTINARMLDLCKLQAAADEIKAELERFIKVGETVSCELGKLTKGKPVETFDWNAKGEEAYKAFKAEALKKGLGKIRIGKSQLRLTLNKAE